jgi:hypothetical protein
LLLTKFVVSFRSEIDQIHRFIERDLGSPRTFLAHYLERPLRGGSMPGGPTLCECSVHVRSLSAHLPFRTAFDGESTLRNGEHI